MIGFLAHSPAIKAASAISLAGIDFNQLCRETAHVPLVQAAIHPAYINVWSVQESRENRRYEQYTFRTQRIDVRVEHDISLYHGLIHRTLDLIGESQWKYRNLSPQEDYEHWLIYHTLEMHWPGMQRRQGNEPTRAILNIASEYWKQYSERYAEIAAKAASLARKSWCVTNKSILEANAAPVRTDQPPERTNPLLMHVAQAARDLPGQAALQRPAPAPTPPPTLSLREPQPKAAAAPIRTDEPPAPQAVVAAQQAKPQQVQSPAALLAAEPIGIASEVAALSRPADNAPKPPLQAQPPKPAPQPATTDRPVPPSPASRIEPVRAASEYFVALPVVEEKSAKPAWPAPSRISADLPADPTQSAGNWR